MPTPLTSTEALSEESALLSYKAIVESVLYWGHGQLEKMSKGEMSNIECQASPPQAAPSTITT